MYACMETHLHLRDLRGSLRHHLKTDGLCSCHLCISCSAIAAREGLCPSYALKSWLPLCSTKEGTRFGRRCYASMPLAEQHGCSWKMSPIWTACCRLQVAVGQRCMWHQHPAHIRFTSWLSLSISLSAGKVVATARGYTRQVLAAGAAAHHSPTAAGQQDTCCVLRRQGGGGQHGVHPEGACGRGRRAGSRRSSSCCRQQGHGVCHRDDKGEGRGPGGQQQCESAAAVVRGEAVASA